mgnify:CR=1 FL=1
MLSDIQEKKLRHFFDVMDDNDNRVLQPDDFTSVASKISDILGHPKHSTHRLQLQVRSYRLFIQLLTDIGKEETNITLDEWLELFDRILHGKATFIKSYVYRTASYIFSMFDQNNDRYITKDEYQDMFKVYDIDMKYLDMGFRKLDFNDDGQISKTELISGFSDFFLSSDPEAPGNWIFGDYQS